LTTSCVDYLGNHQFASSWKWWYVLRLFMGSALVVILYSVAHGGLIAGNSGAGELSPYGVTAPAAVGAVNAVGKYVRRRRAELQQRGVGRKWAKKTACSNLGPWRLSQDPSICQVLPKAFFDALGLPRFAAGS
jgi:hypothetical protein